MFILIVILNLLTSAFTAITGVGGGVILIAFMPMLLPAAAIIPVHAVTQWASNLSRAWLGRRHVHMASLRQYLFGNIAGILVGGWLVQQLSLNYIPLYIGLYILLTLWVPAFTRMINRFENFAIIAFIQTVLSMFVGVGGPMHFSLLMRRIDDHHVVVSTGAAMMVFNHFAKIIVFTWAGFVWTEYGWLLLALIIAASIGSWLGVGLRSRMRMDFLRRSLKYLLTVLALYSIVSAFVH